jgi:hypothetical protein
VGLADWKLGPVGKQQCYFFQISATFELIFVKQGECQICKIHKKQLWLLLVGGIRVQGFSPDFKVFEVFRVF